MPRPASSLPLHRTDINLYLEDVEYLRKTFGNGWSSIVRDTVHTFVTEARKSRKVITIGDLANDR